MAKILVIEDDKYLCEVINDRLCLDKHTVDVCETGTDGLEYLLANQYDVVILDWNLPGMPGVEILKTYRDKHGTAPVLMLTGRNTIDEKEIGLGSGADDYLTKPFNMRELQARVRALLRRSSSFTPEVLKIGKLVLDTRALVVKKGDSEIHLMPKEFALLEFFARNPNELFSAETIIGRVWATEADCGLESLRSCVKRLRKKIDDDGEESIIENVFGVGYRLRTPNI